MRSGASDRRVTVAEEYYLLEDGKLDEWIEAHGFGPPDKPVRAVLIDPKAGLAWFEVWVIDETGEVVLNHKNEPQTYEMPTHLRSLPGT